VVSFDGCFNFSEEAKTKENTFIQQQQQQQPIVFCFLFVFVRLFVSEE
jgi:hypothetical protein